MENKRNDKKILAKPIKNEDKVELYREEIS